jgi:hypothetical protein
MEKKMKKFKKINNLINNNKINEIKYKIKKITKAIRFKEKILKFYLFKGWI